MYVLYTSPLLQKADPVYPSVPQSELLLQATETHDPAVQVCPAEHVAFSCAWVEFEHLDDAVPGFEHVYVM